MEPGVVKANVELFYLMGNKIKFHTLAITFCFLYLPLGHLTHFTDTNLKMHLTAQWERSDVSLIYDLFMWQSSITLNHYLLKIQIYKIYLYT